MKKKPLLFLILAVAACAAYFAYSQFFYGVQTVDYRTFRLAAEEGKLSSAAIYPDKIIFTYTDGTSKFCTQNPQNPELKEFLLLQGIAVSEEKNAEEWLTLFFDVLFYIIFFGAIFIVFRKFISPNTFKIVKKTGVTFENVIGMENLKSDFKKIIQIMKNPKEYAAKGIRMPKGILLEGAPGNGKTLFARAAAGESDVRFIAAKATDFESMFMSIGPAKVKLLFSKARRNAPCIVFIDEFDGIGTKRNYSGSAIETENTRIVTALLNELDGFTPNDGILVIAATNSRDALDKALIRPGRFDAKYTVPYPDHKTRTELAEYFMQGKSHDQSCTAESLAKVFNGFSAAQIESVINRAALVALQNWRESFCMQDVQQALKEQ